MRKPLTTSCVLLSLLALAGCPSRPPVPQCEPPPAPPAWMMQKREPTLTPRLLNELSPSPTTETRQSSP
ncbi:Lipoprotein Rz1 precursor [compost metagenome]